jgi:hypothetical protein
LPLERTLPPGSRAGFEITLVNESDGLLTNLAVSDPLSPDCERPVGSLPDLQPNGGSYSYLCLSPVLSADLLNVATVSADSAAGPVSATASALVRVLAPQTCFTDDTATGSGEATLCFVGSGADCGFEEAAYIALSGDPLSPPAGSAPEGLLFPHGLVVQRIGDGCVPGFTAEFTWELPTVMPADTLCGSMARPRATRPPLVLPAGGGQRQYRQFQHHRWRPRRQRLGGEWHHRRPRRSSVFPSDCAFVHSQSALAGAGAVELDARLAGRAGENALI